MTRSSDYIKQFWRWHFLRLGSPPSSEHGGLFLCFGVLSFVYRLFLYTSIILVIYHTFIKAVAIILVFLELYSIMIYPFFKEIQTVRQLSKQSANWARFYLLILFIGVSSLILFFPLGWNIHLPGEIVPKSQQWVTTNETGFLCDSLKRHAFPVKKNDLICQTHSPHLNFEKKRSQESLRYDLILFDQQQLDLENLGNSQVSKSKIKSDQLVLEELNRREKDLCIKAESDGIFVPEISELSPGAYLPKGYTIGKIVSQKKIIYAYVNEREISKLSLGQKTTIRNADTLQSFKGRISYINPIPSTLKNSPLLQHFGGPIPVYIDNKNPEHYESVFSLFRIEIELDEPITWQIGRTVEVSVHHSERLWERLQQFVISALRREF